MTHLSSLSRFRVCLCLCLCARVPVPVLVLGLGPGHVSVPLCVFVCVFVCVCVCVCEAVNFERNLNFFTRWYKYLVQIVPAVVIGPQYFAGKVPLGSISQVCLRLWVSLGASRPG